MIYFERSGRRASVSTGSSWREFIRSQQGIAARGFALERPVLRHRVTSHVCFLVIEHEGEHFVGTLAFDDPVFHHQITELLQKHIGCSIKDIANLEIALGE